MELYDNDSDDLGDIGGSNISIGGCIEDYLDNDWEQKPDILHMSSSAIETRIKAMQVKMILAASSEIDEFLWVHLYSEDFRKIVTDHPDWTFFQVQHALYMPHKYQHN